MADPVSLAVTAVMTAANMALTMSQKIEGPRLDDTKFTNGDYGASLQRFWGKRRFEAPIFWAENLREVKRRRKTKGGKYNDYTYYGTWAVAVAGHQIAAVTRIWFDTHLVFDATGGGPVSPFDLGGGTIGDYISIYLGTETQDPDPRMQATVESLHGEGSCPAYRGTAYIVFKDVPLERVGNRIPQVSVEAVSSAEAIYPMEVYPTTIPPANQLWNFSYSPDYARLLWVDGNQVSIWDNAARTQIYSGTLAGGERINLSSKLGLRSDGQFYAVSADNQTLYRYSADGLTRSTIMEFSPTTRQQQEVRVLKDGFDVEHWATVPYSIYTYFFLDGTEMNLNPSPGAGTDGLAPGDWFVDDYGDVWVVYRENDPGVTSCHFQRMVNTSGRTTPDHIVATGLSASGGSIPDIHAVHYHDAEDDHFVLAWENRNVYTVDVETGDVTHSTGDILDVFNAGSQFANAPAGASSIWLNDTAGNFNEYSLKDLHLIRSLNFSLWGGVLPDGVIYDPFNHAIIGFPFPASPDTITWRFLDRFDSGPVTLGVIIGDLADEVGVEDHNFTALDQVVQGFSMTQGQASTSAEALLDAYDSDIRPHDFTLQGIKRTGVSGGAILTERFARKGDEARYSVRVRQAAELPRALIYNFADLNADQQPNNVRSDRPLDATGARSEQSLDMGTHALDPSEARSLADRHFRRIWNERREASLSLTAQHLALEPGDCRTLDLDGQADIYRCTRLTIRADDVLQTEWKYDHPGLALLDSAGGASFAGRDGLGGGGTDPLPIPLISKGFVLDIPLLADNDNNINPVVYLFAAPAAEGTWPGATFFRAVDGEFTEESGSVAATDAATWGYATTTLANADPWIWDRGNTVNVMLQNGELSGTTEAVVNASPRTNQALLGQEIINFTTATLEEDGSYTLSGLKRGRRGTEWACDDHTSTDVFLLLDPETLEALGLSDVGQDILFKAITNGRTEAGAELIELDPYTGASLKPYAPAQLEEGKDAGTGDWTLTWVRRTRVGGDWTSGTIIPLSEASEEYEVEILDGSTVVRTETVTDPEFVWTSAMQTTDFGSGQSSVSWRVYQISAAVGRGFAAAA